MMRVLFATLIVLMLLPIFAYAAGTGSGGAVAANENDCTVDVWTCTEFTLCDVDKTQHRNCTMTFDCLSTNTQKPYETVTCQYVSEIVKSLKCTNLKTMAERVTCRLGLNEIDAAQELQIAYLPEECRDIQDAKEKDTCIKTYAQSQPCWKLEMGDIRNGCLKDILNITDISGQRNNCKDSSGCYKDLRKRVYTLAKFKIYDLEERAENMMKLGLITDEEAADIITKLENHKLQFNEASNRDERLIVLNNVKIEWRSFIIKVRAKQ